MQYDYDKVKIIKTVVIDIFIGCFTICYIVKKWNYESACLVLAVTPSVTGVSGFCPNHIIVPL